MKKIKENAESHAQVRAITRSTECIAEGKCLKLVKMWTKTAPGPSLKASTWSLSILELNSTWLLELALPTTMPISDFWSFCNFHNSAFDNPWPCCWSSFSRREESANSRTGVASSGTSSVKYSHKRTKHEEGLCKPINEYVILIIFKMLSHYE